MITLFKVDIDLAFVKLSKDTIKLISFIKTRIVVKDKDELIRGI